MKFCPVDPEICRGQVHGSRKERRRIRIIIIKVIIRNGAKTISLPNFVCLGDLNINVCDTIPYKQVPYTVFQNGFSGGKHVLELTLICYL
jgi:hypothetical protein